MITRGSGPLVDLNRSTETLCDGQFFIRLGTEVFSPATKCLLPLTQTFYVWIWVAFFEAEIVGFT